MGARSPSVVWLSQGHIWPTGSTVQPDRVAEWNSSDLRPLGDTPFPSCCLASNSLYSAAHLPSAAATSSQLLPTHGQSLTCGMGLPHMDAAYGHSSYQQGNLCSLQGRWDSGCKSLSSLSSPLFLPHREKQRDAVFPNLFSPLQNEGAGKTPAKCLKQLIRAAVCIAVNELLSWLELRIYHLLLK